MNLDFSDQDVEITSASSDAPDSFYTILVVTQDPIQSQAIRAHLRGAGYRVLSTANAKEALDTLQKEIPHLILCDIVMPGMDGYELLQETRHQKRLRSVPFIFLSPADESADRRRVKAIGGEDLLSLPVDDTEILSVVETIIQRIELINRELHQQLQAMQNQILGLIQHEFRTPLTLIMGYAEFLQATIDAGPDNEEIRMSIDAILEGSYRLNNLIESFLLLTDLNQRNIELQQISVQNAPGLWREATSRRQQELEDAELQITIESKLSDELLSDIGSRAVFGESSLLCDALVRLLDNAVRYRKNSSRHIHLSVVHRDDEIGWSIQDDGVGIPSDRLDEILYPFVRVHDDARREQTGIGLGLAVVSRIVQLHGGQLTVASDAGEGSIFTLWLPLQDKSTSTQESSRLESLPPKYVQ